MYIYISSVKCAQQKNGVDVITAVLSKTIKCMVRSAFAGIRPSSVEITL